jgi:hypothetical protein
MGLGLEIGLGLGLDSDGVRDMVTVRVRMLHKDRSW